MKLGIKTTGSVSRLKLKTADGVSKAVPCACCDPCSGLWGPGYDDLPMQLTLNGVCTLGRVSKCEWVASICAVIDQYASYYGYYTAGACPLEYYEKDYKVVEVNARVFYGIDHWWLNEIPKPAWELDWHLSSIGDFIFSANDTPPPCIMPDQSVGIVSFHGTKPQDISTPLGVYSMPNSEGPPITVTVT